MNLTASNQCSTTAAPAAPRHNIRRAFTLVEMLVVIAIIGVLAALVLTGVGVAVKRRDVSRVEAELRKLELLINTYKDKWGSYPPDNPGGPVTNSTTN